MLTEALTFRRGAWRLCYVTFNAALENLDTEYKRIARCLSRFHESKEEFSQLRTESGQKLLSGRQLFLNFFQCRLCGTHDCLLIAPFHFCNLHICIFIGKMEQEFTPLFGSESLQDFLNLLNDSHTLIGFFQCFRRQFKNQAGILGSGIMVTGFRSALMLYLTLIIPKHSIDFTGDFYRNRDSSFIKNRNRTHHQYLLMRHRPGIPKCWTETEYLRQILPATCRLHNKGWAQNYPPPQSEPPLRVEV